MDEGWTRWLLERYDFAFSNVYNADVIGGNLRERFDVIIVADISGRQIVDGFAKGSVAPRYVGGIGREGVREIDAFIRTGGTLVTINNSSLFAVEQLHLPVNQDHVRRYFEVSGDNIGWDLIRASYKSVAKLAIIPFQDILSLGSEARFNMPGVAEGNCQLVGRADHDRVEPVEYIQPGKHRRGVAVDLGAELGGDGIEPAHAPGPTRGHAELLGKIPYPLAGLVRQLGGERQVRRRAKSCTISWRDDAGLNRTVEVRISAGRVLASKRDGAVLGLSDERVHGEIGDQDPESLISYVRSLVW